MCKTVILLTATLALLSGQAFAQTAPLACNDTALQSINWNDTSVSVPDAT